jgi:hypothetical protein
VAAETDLGSIDYRALTEPVDPLDVQAFAEETTSRGYRWMPRRGSGGIPPMLVVLALIFIGLPALFLLSGVRELLAAETAFLLIAFGPICVSVIALSAYFIVPSFAAPKRGFGWEEHYRMSRFAWDNGLTYTPDSYKPRYRGLLFNNLPAHVYNHLTPKTGRYFNIGNVRYGGSTTSTTDRAITEIGNRGFLAIHIGGALPHIVLDAKANDGVMGGIGLQLGDQSTFSLEGDFSRHFTLYCPPGYERDALYILTPDLMVDLLDESLVFDVELIGDMMFVYAMKPFDSMDVHTYQRLFRIIETVGARAGRRSTGYRDDQYSSLQAAAAKPRGSRMRAQVPKRFIAFCVAVFLSLAWIPVGLFIGAAIAIPEWITFSHN